MSRTSSYTASIGLACLLSSLPAASCGGGGGSAQPAMTGSSVSGRLMVGPSAGTGGELLEQEPNDSPNQVQFVGELRPGHAYVIAGDSSDDGSDAFDGFRFRTSEALTLHVEIEMLSDGVDLDAFVFDVGTGTALCEFVSTTNPEIGECALDSETSSELDVVLYSAAGASSYLLRISASPAAGSGTPDFAASSAKAQDALARYLGAQHPLATERIVVLESEAASASAARAEFLSRAGLELASRSADGTSLYRLASARASSLRRGAAGAWSGSLEHELARLAWSFSRRAGVRAASLDYRLQAFDEPDDTHYALQWNHPQVRLPLAWDLEQGDASVIVAVIDTGIRYHPELTPRLVGGYDFISSAAASNDGDGMDPDPTDAGDGAGPQPSTWHGTHVSGILGASTDDQAGIAAVDWRGGILSLRALGIGGGSLADIAAAVRYAAGLPNASGVLPAQRADVINLSLGAGAFSAVLQAACDDAFAAGATIVAAAGNEPVDVPTYPAAFESVIGVGAVRYDKQLAPYSSFGPWIDLVAPGGDVSVDQNGDGFPDGVLSTHIDASGAFHYSFQQGTSMACPHVAGVAALLIAAAPGSSPTELRTLLRTSAQDLGAPGVDAVFGFGLVDAYGALVAQSGGGADTPVLVVNPTAVHLGAFESFFPVTLANVGGGFLDITGSEVIYALQRGWLDASASSSSVLTNISHGFLDLSVERAGLAPGSYSATVLLHADGLPSQPVHVLMAVGGDEPPDFTTYVLLVDADDYTTVDQTVTDLSMAYAWNLEVLPPGRYLVVAGTDADADGFIGDPGEPLFGLWPSALEPTVLVIEAPASIPGLDFPVSTLGTLGSLAVGAQGGFARLR